MFYQLPWEFGCNTFGLSKFPKDRRLDIADVKRCNQTDERIATREVWGDGIANTGDDLGDGCRCSSNDPPFEGYTAALQAGTFSTSHRRSLCPVLFGAKGAEILDPRDFRIFINKDRAARSTCMYVPSVVEKVRVRGSDEIFLVTRIDRQSENAHLIRLLGSSDDQVDVPFAQIFPSVFPKRRTKNL